jgi:ribonuclease D
VTDPAASEPAAEDESAVTLLLDPSDGLPDVVTTTDALAAAAERLAGGSGPVAVDAERASGYRYGQRAYLLQLRRRGGGTVLVDPIALPDVDALHTVLDDEEWVLHAASQDLPCLAELGLRPNRLFDTELAGRLLGYPRVGLAAMTEAVLGLRLEKGHSAADWSTRPLPQEWVRYAALDVEVLVELRDHLAAELVSAGKAEWAAQEFAAVAAAPPPAPRIDPWRRTSGLHRVRKPRQLAVVRALWEARDDVAQRRDTSPGRVLPDTTIVEAALALPATREDLVALPSYRGRGTRRRAATWWAAVEQALALPDSELPRTSAPVDGPPPARSWGERNPAAATRLTALKAAVAALADEHSVPTENLLAPDTVRRIAWQPPRPCDEATVEAVLVQHGARPWQVDLTARPLARALDRLTRTEEAAFPE